VEKYLRDRQTTDDSMAHAHCMLDTKGYKRTMRLCIIYCFFTCKLVALKRLSATLYIFCLPCFYFFLLLSKHFYCQWCI